MKVGFTGTRKGMTPTQKHKVKQVLRRLEATEGHHGDCVGGDQDFHDICRELGLKVVVHPPSNPALRAYCQGDEERADFEYLTRNKHIVKETEVLIGAPKEDHEPAPARGQGTWSAIRYARDRMSRVTYIIWP